MIENPRSPRVRAVAKLAKRSGRRAAGLFLVEGPQAVREALLHRPDLLVELFVTAPAVERHRDLLELASGAGVLIETVTEQVLEAMADTVTPQGVVAVCRQFAASLDGLLGTATRLVAILEEARDPGNVGTILRAADAAGADAVILTGNSVDVFNPKVVRSTTGSIFHVPVIQGLELGSVAGDARAAGMHVLAADVSGADLLELRDDGVLDRPTAWVFGNEANGLDQPRLELADRAVRVPIYGLAESMNLSTAASVCLYTSAFAQRTPVRE